VSLPAVISTVSTQLTNVSLPLLAAGLLLQGIGLGLRGLAWRNILCAAYPDRDVPMRGIIGAYVSGVAANGILPAKGGEVVKVALARAVIDRSATPTIVASLGVLSLFDVAMGAVITVALLASGTVPGLDPGHLIQLNPLVIGVVAGGLVVFASAATLVSGLHRRAATAARQALVSLSLLRAPGRYLRSVAALQATAWGCRLGVAATLLAAFGLRPSVPTAATVVVLGGLAGLLPGSPGGVGAQQLVLAYALGATTATTRIVTFSLGMQVAVAAFQVLLGVGALMLTLKIAHPGRAVRALRMLTVSDPAT
jgi:uncharacterized membrane protein YbhN (UPF0104 family)